MNFTPKHGALRSASPAELPAGLLAVGAICAIAGIAANNLADSPSVATAAAARSPDLCASADDAYLSGVLYGALDRIIEWRSMDMRCEGGARPDGDGIRLVFGGPGAVDGDRLVFVIGISGDVDALADSEREANVTVIDESSGRFFSSGRKERCWTTVASVDAAGDDLRVAGEVYCAGSLPSLSDGGSVSLRHFRYSGRLALDAP
ncbi:MAG: hypothetical protein ACE5G3_04040 [Gammaproteobacteria bacterium]